MADYLVDTSVWVEYLRGEKAAIKKRLEGLLDENRAAVSGIVLAELLVGINKETDRDFLEECFLGLPWLETTREVFAEAGKMGAALRRLGIAMPFSGLLIAAQAKAHSLTVLTLDSHFQLRARPLGIRMELLKGA